MLSRIRTKEKFINLKKFSRTNFTQPARQIPPFKKTPGSCPDRLRLARMFPGRQAFSHSTLQITSPRHGQVPGLHFPAKENAIFLLLSFS
jgi:hypothetical protein